MREAVCGLCGYGQSSRELVSMVQIIEGVLAMQVVLETHEVRRGTRVIFNLEGEETRAFKVHPVSSSEGHSRSFVKCTY